MVRSLLRPTPRSVSMLAALLVLGLATPALAAELGGTSWNLGGNFKVKLRGMTNGPAGLAGVLAFDGLRPTPPGPVCSTWPAPTPANRSAPCPARGAPRAAGSSG